ncbi:acyltransferase [Alteraurantiacibacter aestuarii]
MGRIYGLEAIRGIAALIVAAYHVNNVAPFPAAADEMFGVAYLAVDLFFLLSGFVLTRTYEQRMPATATFAVQRYVRLWPPVACGVLVGAFYLSVSGVIGDGDWTGMVMALATGLAILPVIGGTILLNPPAWSIFFELVANAIHAALLRRLSQPMLAAIVAACAIVLALGTGEARLDVGYGEMFWFGIPRVMMSYTLGVLLYRINGDRLWLPARLVWPALAAYALALVLIPAGLPTAVEVAFVLLVHPLVLLAALSLDRGRLALWLGAYSFPLYAIHYPVQFGIARLELGWMPTLAASLIIAAVLGMAVDPRWRRLVLEGLRLRAPQPAAT